jgi:phosphatidylglycerol:prolipoprotein diacylglycerol transferase
VALSWPYFLHRPSEILAIWNGGMSIHGGIIGGFLTAAIYSYYARLPALRIIDIGACVTPLAQAVGRWGNFFNSEAFGKPVPDDFPVKLLIDQDARPIQYFNHQYFHPTFLYEGIWNLFVFFFLYYVASKKLSSYPGTLFLLYLALYSIGRLLIEPIRTDSIMAGTIPVPIIASGVTLVGACLLFAGLLWRYKRASGKEPEKADTDTDTDTDKIV